MPALFEIVAAGVLGGLIGSFLNVVIWRLPRGESIVSPGSRCPSCERPIAPYDNLPVVSWLLLRGRCRHCAAPISARYPLVELVTALAFAAVVAVRGVRLGARARAALRGLPDRPGRHRLRPQAAAQPDRLPDGGLGPGGHPAGRPRRPGGEPDRGRRRLSVPVRRPARLSARHGHGRRQAGRGHGPVPGAGDRPGHAHRLPERKHRRVWRSSRAKERRRARRRSPSGCSWPSAG